MSSPRNWDSKHENYSKSSRFYYMWEHRNAPAKIYVQKALRGTWKNSYSVRAKYKGVNNDRIAKSGIHNKEEARSKAVKLARMYSNPQDLREDITKVEFGDSL